MFPSRTHFRELRIQENGTRTRGPASPGLWRGLRPVGSVRIVDEARTNMLHGWSPRTSIRSLLNRAAGESTAEAAAGVVTGCGTRRMETAALDATDHVRALAPILRKYLGVATTGQSIPRAGD